MSAKARSRRPRGGSALIMRVRRICMALPEANEKLSHGEPTWFAGKVATAKLRKLAVAAMEKQPSRSPRARAR